MDEAEHQQRKRRDWAANEEAARRRIRENEQKPRKESTRKIGSAEYSPDKAAARQAERYGKQYEEMMDKRSPLDKFKDENEERRKTKLALAEAVPRWKAAPVEPPPEGPPIIPREPIWGLAELHGPKPIGSRTAAMATFPLKIVQVDADEYKVLTATVAGFSVAEYTPAAVSGTGTKYLSCEVTVGYNASTGVWSVSAAAMAVGASYSSPTATKLVIQVGTVAHASSVIGTITQVSGGNQWAARTGSAATYVDANGSLSEV